MIFHKPSGKTTLRYHFSFHSLWIKFFICYIFPTLFFLFLWITLSAIKAQRADLASLLQYRETLNTQLMSALESGINDLSQQSYIIYSDTDNLVHLYEGPGQIGYFSSRNNFQQTIKNFLQVTNQMDGLVLFDLKGDTVLLKDRTEGVTSFPNMADSQWFCRALDAPSDNHHIFTLTLRRSGKNVNAVALSKVIYNPDSRQALGVLLCYSYVENFVRLLSESSMVPGELLQLTDENGAIVYQSTEETFVPIITEHQESYDLVTINDRPMLRSFVSGSQYGWNIVSYTPHSSSSFYKTVTENANILTIFLIIIASLGISSVISLAVTRPLSQLTASFGQVAKGNFNAKVAIKGTDELAEIGQSYNQMLDMIQDLLKERYELKLGNTQARLEALQSQINPHFLYNTLNSIKAVSYEGESEKVSQMVQSLSDLMRYTLNHGKYLVTLSEELSIVQKYLYLQEYRFSDRYSVSYDVDPETLDLAIPCLTVQPLVENAIRHGLEHVCRDGRLIITAKLIESKLYIYISNTGPGLSAQKQEELNEKLKEVSESTDFSCEKVGLLNVGYRLKLYCHNQYDLKISSTRHFTTVKLVIPAVLFEAETVSTRTETVSIKTETE